MRLPILLLILLSACCCYPFEEETIEKDNGEDKSKNIVDEILEINKEKSDIHIEEFPEGIKTPYSAIKSNLLKRGLRRAQQYLWIDRVVPYEITVAVEHGKTVIEKALKELADQSCIKFVPHSKEKNWIRFVDEGGCFSGVGRTFWREGSQKISLARGCLYTGTIMHEVLHALGFWHEQSRADRDKYVEIFWENISEDEENNFDKYSLEETNSQHVDYDLESIMHYGKYSFSKNGEPTMIAIGDRAKPLGQRDGLSKHDAMQLNLLYKCKDVGKSYTTWSEWAPCDQDSACRKSRQRFCSSYDKKKCPEASVYGIHTDYQTCPDKECYRAINGHWNKWSPWTTCDKPCGTGRKTRKRICDDPAPRNGGKRCNGESMAATECYIVPCGLGPDDCQFDSQNMCYWENISPTNYGWKRIKGKTPSGKTGPDADHSTGKGYYLYTESSSPAALGMKANLISKTFPRTEQRCIAFFYSMHGVNIGALRVYIVHESSDTEMIWNKSGPQGADWKEAELSFSSKYPYKIKFESERGESFLGDIGLDDIQFKDGSCGEATKQNLVPIYTTPPALPTTRPTEAPINQICGIRVKPLGCYAEIPQDPAIPFILDNHRSAGSKGFHGTVLSWTDYKGSLNSLFCDCVNLAKSRGFPYFGMQWFGECWGVGKEPRYNKYGISTLCIDSKFQSCYHGNYQEVCMGKAQTNYVYEIV